MRLRQPLFPWWAFFVLVLVVDPISRGLYKRFCATGMPFWDFVGPLLPSALLLVLTVLYFMRRRLDDLTTVAQTRLPRKSRKRAHRGG